MSLHTIFGKSNFYFISTITFLFLFQAGVSPVLQQILGDSLSNRRHIHRIGAELFWYRFFFACIQRILLNRFRTSTPNQMSSAMILPASMLELHCRSNTVAIEYVLLSF